MIRNRTSRRGLGAILAPVLFLISLISGEARAAGESVPCRVAAVRARGAVDIACDPPSAAEGVETWVLREAISGEAVGYARAGRIFAHSLTTVPIVGDFAEPFPPADPKDAVPGRPDLLLGAEAPAGTASRYRSHVHLGLLGGETAAMLSPREAIVSLTGQVFYGVHRRLSASTFLLYDLSGVPNLRLKLNAIDGEAVRLSFGLQALVISSSTAPARPLKSFHLYMDTLGNSRLISHLALAAYDDLPEETGLRGSFAQTLFRSTIQNSYEFVLSSWNRVVAGPLYDFQTRAVGGYLGHMWVRDRVHFSIGLRSQALDRFELTPEGYQPFVDLYWRF